MEFRCKNFSINHSRSSMKVGSDAIFVSSLSCKDISPSNILDIGCGCGIISLCMAQDYPKAFVIGIDIDMESINQASENFLSSQYSHRLNAINIDFNMFSRENNKENITENNIENRDRFDLIITNPPFFLNSLLPSNPKRLLSRHALSLNYRDLLEGVSRLLNPKGIFTIILPFDYSHYLLGLLGDNNLYLKSQFNLINHMGKPPKRVVFHISNSFTKDVYSKDIILRNNDNTPSQEYYSLVSNYLL